ncbi:glycosyl hydrolase family 28-related protein [Paenibacillus sp. Dod16]|uniref:glycosyl hydrolase family 28-related protein n=1 Tax=Paenibacillus sp. Dod16 TaxID=3416392 RepID=UPI003CF0AC72
MASRYGGITGSKRISEDFQNINTAFENVQADMDSNKTVVDNHIVSTSAHEAKNITYSGSAAGTNVKEAVEGVNDRVNQIIQGGGPDKDAELVDIRTPDPTYMPLRTITVAGDIVRDMQAQFGSQLADFMINVKLFGATGDGVTDDTLAIQSGIDEAVSKKGTLYLPPGVYKLTNVLNAAGSNFGIKGAGKGKTVLITNTHGFDVQGDSVSLEGFSLHTTESTSHGITITGNYHSIKNVLLQGDDLANDYWDKSIYCKNLWYSELSEIDVFGGTQNILRQGSGIYADYSVNNKINKCLFNSVDYGVYLSNAVHPVHNFRCEGWSIRDNIFIVSNYGVYALSGLFISVNECIIDIIQTKGIYMEVGGSCSIANNWIAAANEDSNFVGIHIKSGEKIVVTSNNISSKNALGVGIKVESSYNIITANTLFSTNIGVLIENQFNTITSNLVNGMGSYAIRVASANCVVSGNYIDNSRIFADSQNWNQFDKWATTVVVTLAGGLTQNIDVPIANGAFSAVPVIGFLQSASAGAKVSAYYDVDNPATTNTNARFVVYMPNGTNLPTTTARFSVFLANADFFI